MQEFFMPAGGFPGALTYNAHCKLLFLIPNVRLGAVVFSRSLESAINCVCDQLPNAPFLMQKIEMFYQKLNFFENMFQYLATLVFKQLFMQTIG
jgi:hypothetical protein